MLASFGSLSTDLRKDDLVEFLGISTIFVAAEGLILHQMGEYGLIVHGVGLITTLVLISASSGATAMLYQSMLLIPILRIVNFGIPIFIENSILMLAVLYSFLSLSLVFIVRSQNLSYRQLGLTLQGLRLGALGLGVGVFLGAIQYSMSLETIEYEHTVRNYLLLILTAGVMVGLVEELIFRGLIQRWATVRLGPRVAIVVTSVLFGTMHSVWLTPLDIAFAGTVSLFFGWVYARTNNMWFIAGAHAMINVTAFLLGPLYFGAFRSLIPFL